MEIFDYVTFGHNSVAKGGDLKSNFLATQGRADALKFDCKPMNDLMKDLRSTFSVRYEAPPSEVFARFDIQSNFADTLAAIHERRQCTLREQGWLVKTILKHLDKEWPENDEARRNDLLPKKRKRQDTEQNSGVKSRRSNNNRSSSKLMQ